jgi:hypothetical protein
MRSNVFHLFVMALVASTNLGAYARPTEYVVSNGVVLSKRDPGWKADAATAV